MRPQKEHDLPLMYKTKHVGSPGDYFKVTSDSFNDRCRKHSLTVVTHTSNPSTRNAEAGGSLEFDACLFYRKQTQPWTSQGFPLLVQYVAPTEVLKPENHGSAMPTVQLKASAVKNCV